MKKVLFFVNIFVTILFSSCIFDHPVDYQITNNTDYDVAVTSIYDEKINIKAGETVQFTGHYQTSYNIEDETLRVKEVYYSGENKKITYIRIDNLPCYIYYPFNKSNFTIHITEKNNMIGESYGDSYYIKSGEVIELKSYTQNPEYVLYYYIDNKDFREADLSELIF